MRNLATIMVRPRETMRLLLDAARERGWLVIVLLASISAAFGDTERDGFVNIRRASASYGVPFGLILLGMLVAILAAFFILFYLFSLAAWAIGKAMEGTGSARDVRRAVAWGLTPVVWALLYRVPVALFWNPPLSAQMKNNSGKLTFNPGQFGDGCLFTIVIAVLELIVFAWCIYVTSNTVGEAHRFSSWRGLASVVLTSIAPLILVIAAVLAM